MKTPFILLLAAVALPVWADDAALPGDGFQSSRYEKLWTKSPFSVATPDAVETSPDYALVGIMQLDGIAYVSIVDTHTSDHFIVSSDKDTKGLKLSSINHGTDSKEIFATVLKDGQPLTLKLATQAPPTAAPGQENAVPPNMPMAGQPPVTPQNIPMPGANNPPPISPGNAGAPGSLRPFSRLHRSPIHLPPTPQGAPQGQPAPPPANGAPPPNGGAPVQPHVVPPQ